MIMDLEFNMKHLVFGISISICDGVFCPFGICYFTLILDFDGVLLKVALLDSPSRPNG